jgi:Mn-dependent DtxR family transcriptional regulator
MHTLSEENYLKCIYRLQDRGQKITPTAIAESLGNNPASVVDMIRKLTDKQLIAYDKKKGVELTAQGQKDATLIVRRHRLWEVFLLEKLDYHWDEIHDIAEELEHIKTPPWPTGWISSWGSRSTTRMATPSPKQTVKCPSAIQPPWPMLKPVRIAVLPR